MKKKIDILFLNQFKNIFLTLIILFGSMLNYIYAQDGTDSVPDTKEKIKTVLKLSSVKNSDESRTLIGIVSYKDKETKESFDIKDVSVNFYVGVDSVINLGTVKTDAKGKAICNIKSGFKFPKNEEGLIHFSADLEGNDAMRSASNEVDVKDLIINISLDEVDSVRTVTVKVEQILANDEKVPLNEVEMPVFVARMFSHLKIGAITLAEGEGTLEFPKDLPGDTIGNVVVIAKFEDNEEYGTVIKSDTIAWGIKTRHFTAYSPRSLWTQVAPIWMIITLSIMLLGVWGHYIFVIIQLIRLKRSNKQITIKA